MEDERQSRSTGARQNVLCQIFYTLGIINFTVIRYMYINPI